jgi:hypothetical protein
MLAIVASSCGDQGAKLVNSSDQSCADKVALAMNSSQPVSGAWDCLGTTMKAAYADIGVTGDGGIAHNLNAAKYMSTVKFVGHRSLYDDITDNRFLLYRVEGDPDGHVVGYTEIQIDPASGVVQSEQTTYCKPPGDLLCNGLPA